MKYFKTAGLMSIYTCIFFILFSGDFYGDKTIIPVSIFYFPLGFILMWIILFFVLRKREIKGLKVLVHILISMSIFITITQGIRAVANDVLENYYAYTEGNSLLYFPQYIEQEENLFEVKIAILKEGIFVNNLSDRYPHGLALIDTIGPIDKDPHAKIYYDSKLNYFFVYNWKEKRVLNKISFQDLKDKAIDKLKINKYEIYNMTTEYIEIKVDDTTTKKYYFEIVDGKIILEHRTSKERIELD